MFYLSLVLGAAFLVMMHHLFDASWSVGIRRFCEHLACLVFPWMALFFLPVALLSPKIYQWMGADPRLDHALAAKWPLFTRPGFWLAAAVCLGVWALLAWRLRYWSLKQDEDGAAQCTHRMQVPLLLGDIRLWVHAHTGGDHVDEGAAIPVVLPPCTASITLQGAPGWPWPRLT